MSSHENASNGRLLVIGICGESGAGKTTSTDILKSHGFVSFSVSALVREEVTALYSDQSREEIQRYAKDKQAKEGADYFAKKFLKESTPFMHSRVVLDGIRNMKELITLRDAVEKQGGILMMMGMVTRDETRFHRVQSRGRSGDPACFEEFKAADTRAADHGDFQENRLLVEKADFQIVNDGTVEDLEQRIMDVVDQLNKGTERV